MVESCLVEMHMDLEVSGIVWMSNDLSRISMLRKMMDSVGSRIKESGCSGLISWRCKGPFDKYAKWASRTTFTARFQ